MQQGSCEMGCDNTLGVELTDNVAKAATLLRSRGANAYAMGCDIILYRATTGALSPSDEIHCFQFSYSDKLFELKEIVTEVLTWISTSTAHAR